MRRIAFINEKGGTGKTTLAVNVSAYLARAKDLRVLLVDLDTQGHAGKSLGLDVRSISPNVFHLLADENLTLADVVRPTQTENLHVIPSHKDMSELPTLLARDPRRMYRLADRMEEGLSEYDLVVFDSPPSLGLTTYNILVAATEVVVPVALTYFSLDGCAEIVESVRRIAEDHGKPELRVTRVVPTLGRNTSLAGEILKKLRVYFGDTVTREPLGYNVKIDEAQSHGKTIWEYAPRSKGAQMLANIAEEIYASPQRVRARRKGAA